MLVTEEIRQRILDSLHWLNANAQVAQVHAVEAQLSDGKFELDVVNIRSALEEVVMSAAATLLTIRESEKA